LLDAVTSLVDQSLLRHAETEIDEPRFTMLETIREYALEWLAASGEEDAIRRRHAIFFLGLGEALESGLVGAAAGAVLEQLERDHDNLRAALHWAIAHGVAELALRLSGALWRFWWRRGHLVEGRKWLETALASSSMAPASARAKALRGAGVIAYAQGDYAQAIAFLEAGLTLFQELGDRNSSAALLNNLGLATLHQGHYERAASLFEESLTLYQVLGDAKGSALPLAHLGHVESLQGHYAAARGRYEESLALARLVNDLHGSANALNELGALAYREGDYASARSRYSESLALHRELGDNVNTAIVLGNLAEVAWKQGNYAEARAVYGESLVICREVGQMGMITFVLEGFAGLATAQQQAARAARLWGAAQRLRETIGEPIPPVDRPQYDATVAVARAQLDEVTFAAAWAAGRALDLEQAIVYALDTRM